jgi:hypothetical protein
VLQVNLTVAKFATDPTLQRSQPLPKSLSPRPTVYYPPCIVPAVRRVSRLTRPTRQWQQPGHGMCRVLGTRLHETPPHRP